MERAPNTQYILSLSYGKDSIAAIEACVQLGYPIDRIVHAEIWATDTIHADLPPMVAFKAQADRIILARYGLTVEHTCATRDNEKLTYEKLFYHVPKRKNLAKVAGGGGDLILGFPMRKGNWCTSDLKRAALRNLRVSPYDRRIVQAIQAELYADSLIRSGVSARNSNSLFGEAPRTGREDKYDSIPWHCSGRTRKD